MPKTLGPGSWNIDRISPPWVNPILISDDWFKSYWYGVNYSHEWFSNYCNVTLTKSWQRRIVIMARARYSVATQAYFQTNLLSKTYIKETYLKLIIVNEQNIWIWFFSFLLLCFYFTGKKCFNFTVTAIIHSWNFLSDNKCAVHSSGSDLVVTYF